MRATTETVTIPAAWAEVFLFVADPANLPIWAIRFAKAIAAHGDGWIVTTELGAVPIRYETEPRFGIVDMHMTPPLDSASAAHLRVLPSGDETELVFTFFQTPEMRDEVFAGQAAALRQELDHLRALFAARSASIPAR